MKSLVRDAQASATAAYLGWRWRRERRKRSAVPTSGLPVPLVVSLTSYPPRFPTLLPTLQSLLLQSLRPDYLELWIAEADCAALPPAVVALQNHGLAIRTCADLRSFKKIIPALTHHSDAIIVTADDDAYYWTDWLRQLVAAYDPTKYEVLCHRAHRITLCENGLPQPYQRWVLQTPETDASRLVFPTGLGGVLYRPGIFMADVSQRDRFMVHCPTADDVWLFWMASLNGATFRKVGPVRRFTLWRGGQEVALYNHNVVGADANDVQIAAMIEAYGFPATAKGAPA